MKHAFLRRTPAEIEGQRLPLIEEQLTAASHARITAARERDAAQQQAAALAVALWWLLQSYAALTRARPAGVLDTGTPGVEVTR